MYIVLHILCSRASGAETVTLRLLDLTEVAVALSVSRGTVRRWLATGRLRSVKLGNASQSRVRIPADWLAEDLGVTPDGDTSTSRLSPAERQRRGRQALETLDALRLRGHVGTEPRSRTGSSSPTDGP